MFKRVFKELEIQNLRLHSDNDESLGRFRSNNPERQASPLIALDLVNTSSPSQSFNKPKNLDFLEIMKNYNEKFIVLSQGGRPLLIDLNQNDMYSLFNEKICRKIDGRSSCRSDCSCPRSVDLAMQLYEKGGVHNFHQLGNYLIGAVVEQQTDPMSRIAVEFDGNMRNILSIYCKCRLFLCPHAYALIYFRAKVNNFYAIRLPNEIYHKDVSQLNLTKFYGFLLEEARSLPMFKDFHTSNFNQEQSYKQNFLQAPFIYAYCHKILLPPAPAILLEQTRARKWINDLYMKRQHHSMTSLAPVASAGDLFHMNEHENRHMSHKVQTSLCFNSSKSHGSKRY